MKQSHFKEKQIIRALRKQEPKEKTTEVCREIGISQVTFFKWKRKFGGMSVADAKRLRELEQAQVGCWPIGSWTKRNRKKAVMPSGRKRLLHQDLLRNRHKSYRCCRLLSISQSHLKEHPGVVAMGLTLIMNCSNYLEACSA